MAFRILSDSVVSPSSLTGLRRFLGNKSYNSTKDSERRSLLLVFPPVSRSRSSELESRDGHGEKEKGSDRAGGGEERSMVSGRVRSLL